VPVSAGALEPHALINARIAIKAGTANARRLLSIGARAGWL
jgi:hypothetical protein